MKAARDDRKVGQVSKAKREEAVVAKQEELVHEQPVRIEPAVTKVPKSVRAEKEKQSTLFTLPPDPSSGELPAIGLLVAPSESQEPVSGAALECPSRRVERTACDCGVRVTVLVPQAGPGIARYEIHPATRAKGSQI